MRRVFLSLGSNVQPEIHVPACLKSIQKTFKIIRHSSIYETDPVGPAGDKKFWNLTLEIETDQEKSLLVESLRKIEKKHGRTRSGKNKFEPRTIDIDLLPQEGYQTMSFIIIPLAEMAPESLDPETGKSFSDLAACLPPSEKTICRKIRNA